MASSAVWIGRAALGVLVALLISEAHAPQPWLDAWWSWLAQRAWFRSSLFETVLVTVYYGLLVLAYAGLACVRALDRFRLEPLQRPLPQVDLHPRALLRMLAQYAGPLVLLDLSTQKCFCGLGPAGLVALGSLPVWTRPLPAHAPQVWELALVPVAALLLYDAVFALVHRFVLHGPLWRHVHAHHHAHPSSIEAVFTNQLSLGERLFIVLLANECLKALCAHPLTRVVFIALFVFLLVDSHSGYAFPWSYERVLPFLGGSRSHFAHHRLGNAHWQPFFTHLEGVLARR